MALDTGAKYPGETRDFFFIGFPHGFFPKTVPPVDSRYSPRHTTAGKPEENLKK